MGLSGQPGLYRSVSAGFLLVLFLGLLTVWNRIYLQLFPSISQVLWVLLSCSFSILPIWLSVFWFFGSPLVPFTCVYFVGTHLFCSNLRPFILAYNILARASFRLVTVALYLLQLVGFAPISISTYCNHFLLLDLVWSRFWPYLLQLFLICPVSFVGIKFSRLTNFLAISRKFIDTLDLRLSLLFVCALRLLSIACTVTAVVNGWYFLFAESEILSYHWRCACITA